MMTAEITTEHRQVLTETLVQGRIVIRNESVAGNEEALPVFDLETARVLVDSGHLSKDGDSFVITEKGRNAERISYGRQEGHARDENPPSRGGKLQSGGST
jgi:hypothetical protein